MANVYISHSRLDRGFAEQFSTELRKHEHQPTGDIQGHKVSQDWDKELLDALTESDVVVFLFTPNASGSENLLAEVGSGKVVFNLLKRPHLIPVVFPGGILPQTLSRVRAQLLSSYPTPGELAVLINTLIGTLPKIPRSSVDTLAVPSKVTGPWLWEFVPVNYWWALLVSIVFLILGTFTIGIQASRINWVAEVFKIPLVASKDTSQSCESVADAVQAAVGVIRTPSAQKIVSSPIPVYGMATIAKKCVSLWLAVEINERIWPRAEGQFTVDEVSQWNQSVLEQGNPDKFALSLWASNPTTDSQLREELGRGKTAFSFAEMRQLGMKRLDIVKGLQLDQK